jgi:hypothetical protein
VTQSDLAPRTHVAIGSRGLELRTLDDLWRFSQYVAKSGLAPKGMQSAEQVLVAIQTGSEAGMTPLRALSSVVVINGSPSWRGDAARALVENSGELKVGTSVQSGVRGEGEQMVGWCKTWRREEPEAHESTFGVADAKRAGLWGKQGPWVQYPKRMLMYRAMGFHLRDHFSHVLLGLRIAEEQQDIELQQVTASNGSAPPSLPTWAMTAVEQPTPDPLPSNIAPEPLPAEIASYDCPHGNAQADEAGNLVCRHCGTIVQDAEAPAVLPDGRDGVSSEPLPPDETPEDTRTIGPDEQAQLFAVVRERARELYGSGVTQAQERGLGAKIMARHYVKRSDQIRMAHFADVLDTARTIQ